MLTGENILRLVGEGSKDGRVSAKSVSATGC